MPSSFLDDLAAQDTGKKAAARGSFLDEVAAEDERGVRPSADAPQGEKPKRGFGRGGFAPSDELLKQMRDNPATRAVQAVIDDPVNTAMSIPAGINSGVARIPGILADTAQNVVDLGGAGYSTIRSLITGEDPNELYQVPDRENVMFTGDWFARKLDDATTALGAGPVTRLPANNPIARILYNTAASVPSGAIGGGGATPLVSSAAGGAAGALAAEAGGDPSLQAAASLLAGHAASRAMEASPNAPMRAQSREEPTQTRTGFERENMGASAAAMDLKSASPNLRAAIEQAAKDGSLNREVATRHIEADSLPIPMRLTRGQATQDPSILSQEQNLRGTDPRFAADFKQQNQQLIDNLDELRATAAPNVVHADPVQSGQALIDAYKNADAPLKAAVDAKYQAMRDAAGGDFPIDTKTLLTNVRGALKKDLASSKAPSDVMGALEEAATTGKMSFEEFEAMRTSLARVQRSSADGQERHAAGVIRDQIEQLPLIGGSAELKKLADEARAAHRARAERIKADPAYRAAVDDDTPVGELSPLADNFVDKFVVKGKAANLQRMQENLGADDIAKETIAAGALNYLKQKSGINAYTNEGNFSQAGYNRALAELTPKLKMLLPNNLSDQVQALGNVARYTLGQPRGSFVNNSNTFVAAAAERAMPILEGVLNVHAGGLPVGSYVRKKIEARRARKFYEESTAPAAGVKLNSLLDAEQKP